MSNYSQNFTDLTTLTFDDSLIDVDGGVAKLKDIRESGWAFFDNFSDASNATYGRGTLTRTLTNATIVDGELDCTGGTPKTANYENDNLESLVEEIKIDFKFKPDFNGIPPADTPFLFHLYNATANQVQCYVTSTGTIVVRAYDSSGVFAINRSISKTDWVQNQQYRFVLFIKSGDSRLYLDETLLWTDTNTWTRTSQPLVLYIGNSSGKSNLSNFKFDDFYISSSVGSYELDSTYNIYSISNPTILFSDTNFYMLALESFTYTATITGNDSITAIQKKGDDNYYYNEGWIVSDDTFLQSTALEDVNTYKSTFTTERILYGLTIFLHSEDGMTTPEISLLSIGYEFAGEEQDTIDYCAVWGYSTNLDGTPNSDKIVIKPKKKTVKYKNSTIFLESKFVITPSTTDGFWKKSLIENENMEDGSSYLAQYKGRVIEISVPNQSTAMFNSCF